MGCNSSKVDPSTDGTEAQKPTKHASKNGIVSHEQSGKQLRSGNKKSRTDTNANRADVSSNNPVPKSISFDVALDGEQSESLIKKHPPRRLSRLDPLARPVITADILVEKQKLADEKRQEELNRKKSASGKTSRRRMELIRAREFEKQQKETEIERKEQQATALKQAKIEEVKTKQKLRNERAKRARARAKKQEEEDQLDIEVEKDENYNDDDDDSWLGNHSDSDDDEKIYSGYSSPQKTPRKRKPQPSASTLDSYDNAFMRQPSKKTDNQRDDFFDS